MIPGLPLHVESLHVTNVEFVVFLVVGLLGGAHCLGMCGPLVTVYSKHLTDGSGDGRGSVLTLHEVRQHALFNAGRTVSYAVLGAGFGLAGALVFDAASTFAVVGNAVRATSGIAIGLFILVIGGRYALGHQGGHGLLGSGPFARLYARFASRLDSWVNGPGMVGLGLVHGLLPCPILYPAFLYAFSRGSPAVGAVSLGLLGLGTFPTLFLYGTLIQSVDRRHRERLHRALGVSFLVMGWMPLAHGLGLLGIAVPHVEVPIYQPF